MEQADPIKYPKWLMHDPVKDAELSVFIHMAKPNAVKLLKSGVGNHGEWLDEISNRSTFDTLAWFALRAGIFTEQMYGSIV
jgi:hypothetical protein